MVPCPRPPPLPRERDVPPSSRTCIYMYIYIYISMCAHIFMCACLCVPACRPRTRTPSARDRANSSRDGQTSPDLALTFLPVRCQQQQNGLFLPLLLPRAANAFLFSFIFFFFCSLPPLSLSICPSLSLSLPPGPRPRSPPDNLPFLLQILNTCCPTALSRRDMCSLLPGSFACALAEVCIRPGPAADPAIAPIPASSCLVPAPPCPVAVCVVCPLGRGAAAGSPAPPRHPVASSTVIYAPGAARPLRVHI